MKIGSLTAEQSALLPKWHDEWLQIGMDERPVDRELARSAISRAYKLIGKDDPLIVFCDSPATSSLGIAVWPHLFRKSVSLRDSLWASLGVSLRVSLRDTLWASLGVSLRVSLRDSLWDSLGVSLWDSLGVSLRDSLGDSLRAISRSTWFFGQHDSYWVSFYRFCAEIGVQYKPDALHRLAIMEDLCRSCGWIYFYENVCFVSGRPAVHTEVIERNDHKIHRLHCENGPAMSFSDGFSIYAWHGTRVPDHVILHPEQITPKQILTERNAEIRRVMIERYGQDRFVNDAGAKEVSRGPDGELLRIDLEEDEPIVALRLRCPSTSAVYIIRVPPDQNDFVAAKAWTFGLKKSEYVFAQES